MSNINAQVELFLELGKAQSIIARRFDRGLGGLGLSEFMILYHLSIAENQTMRRIDLAEKVGLTPSGITRLLAPMEKIGLIKKETFAQDARVSQIMLAPGGKTQLEEGMERAEILAEDILTDVGIKNVKDLMEGLRKLGKTRV